MHPKTWMMFEFLGNATSLRLLRLGGEERPAKGGLPKPVYDTAPIVKLGNQPGFSEACSLLNFLQARNSVIGNNSAEFLKKSCRAANGIGTSSALNFRIPNRTRILRMITDSCENNIYAFYWHVNLHSVRF
jgi:hypothetical protein